MGNSKSKSKGKGSKKNAPPSNSNNVTPASQKKVVEEDEKKSENDHARLRKQSSAQLAGLEIIKKGFVKIDHFENIYRIEPKVKGAPNFRQAKGFYIFGGGQPTIDAHELLLTTFKGK